MDGKHALRTLPVAAAWLGVGAALFLLWIARDALLLTFAGILLSLLLRLMADGICRAIPLPQGWALFLATLFLVLLVGGCLLLFGANLAAQFHQMMNQAHAGLQQLENLMRRNGVSPPKVNVGDMLAGREIPALLMQGAGMLEVAVIALVMAIYLAAQPTMYRQGTAMLIPPGIRRKGLEAFDLIGASLKLWLMGQLCLMLLVGMLSYVVLLLIGLPNAIVLAIIAGLSEAVPYLGPFIGAVPAVLVALTQGFAPMLWTILAYLGVHLIEGYLVGPVLQRWFVHIPPAVILASLFAAQLIFGLPGMILGAPFAVAVFAGVKIFYLRDTLGQPAEMPEHPPF